MNNNDERDHAEEATNRDAARRESVTELYEEWVQTYPAELREQVRTQHDQLAADAFTSWAFYTNDPWRRAETFRLLGWTTPVPAELPQTNIQPGDPRDQHYPQATSHQWGGFAVLAVEMGGYGDLGAVSPYSGDRFWMSDAFPEGMSIYDSLRKLVDAMEREQFLTHPEQDARRIDEIEARKAKIAEVAACDCNGSASCRLHD